MSSFIQCSREWGRREEGGGRERGKERESQEEYERGKAREGGARGGEGVGVSCHRSTQEGTSAVEWT